MIILHSSAEPTERLLLRRHHEEDLHGLYRCLSDPEVVAFEPYEPMSMDQTMENLRWRMSTDEMIAVELAATGRFIGSVYLGRRECNSLEMGYILARDCWGMGYAHEACRRLIELAFEGGTHRIFAQCDPENHRSWQLLERLGFAREGHLRSNVFFRTDPAGTPIWKDTLVYGLVNGE